MKDNSPVLYDKINLDLVNHLNAALQFFDEKAIGRDVFKINNQMWMLFDQLIQELKKHYPVDDMGDEVGNC